MFEECLLAFKVYWLGIVCKCLQHPTECQNVPGLGMVKVPHKSWRCGVPGDAMDFSADGCDALRRGALPRDVA